MHYAFIGGGNMATSLVGGLRARGVPAERITAADPVAAQRERLHREFGIEVTEDNAAAVRGADTVVLCVKPQDMAQVARGIAGDVATRRRVVISIAAGIRSAQLAAWLGGTLPSARAMRRRPRKDHGQVKSATTSRVSRGAYGTRGWMEGFMPS